MTNDELRSAIDEGDVERVRTVLAADLEAARRVFWWGDPAGGGDYTEAISYVSLAPFHGLADHGRMGAIARQLLAAGAPPDGDPDWAETPIVTAASYNEPDVAAALVEAGADPVGRGFAAPGGTALAHAVFFGNPEVARVLLDAGAPIANLAQAAGTGRLDQSAADNASGQDRAQALRAAAVCEQLDVIDRLLAAGLAVDITVDGVTALHWAAFHGKPAAVEHLVGRGADPQRREPAHDATPLDWCRHRHQELFRASPGHDAVESYLAG